MSILVATDFSENSSAAIRTAARLAKVHGQELVLLHCLETAVDDTAWRHMMEMPKNLRGKFWKAAVERMEKNLDELVDPKDRPEDVDFRVEFEYAEEGVLKVVDEGETDLVVIGATGQGRLANFLLGSTTEDVVRRSDTPVLVVPAETRVAPFERIVAPVDFTECSRISLQNAAEIAREDGAELLVVHAYALPVTETTFLPAQMPAETIEAFETQRHKALEEFVGEVDLTGVEWQERLEVSAPHNAIVDVVRETGADLIVMGTHGRRGFERLFLGSTATKVLRRMPCPVMTIRTRDSEPNDEE